MDVAKNVDELITKLDTISQKINRAESGYAGFWDVTKIKESELDKIYEIDSEIATIADELKIGINEFEKSKEEEYDTNLEKIIQKIESFDSKFNQRTDQLKGFDEK
jgi:DNA repair exonuclease SbcCD ATPase subunit